jgi:phage terminase large subunit-like protein
LLRLGDKPRCAIATTPKPTKILRALLAREGQDVVVSRSSSYENRANLAPSFFEQITKRYEGTRLGRQELLAELLDDTPGAVWTRDRIEELRRDAAPSFRRIAVAIDPAGSAEGDETGILVAGIDEAGDGWVLADESGHYQPTGIAGRRNGPQACHPLRASSRHLAGRDNLRLAPDHRLARNYVGDRDAPQRKARRFETSQDFCRSWALSPAVRG